MTPYTRSIVAVLAAAFVARAASLGAQAQPGGPEPAPPKSIAMPKPVDVPLEDPGMPGASLPVINVMINGRGPYRFGVETGAGFVAISRELAATLELKRVAGDDDLPEYDLDSLTFGGAAFRTVRVAAISRNARGVDGLLGLPFFRNVTFTIDYPANRFRVWLDTLPAPNGNDVLSISRVGPFWGLPIELGGQRFTAVLDTRSMAGLSVTPTVAAPLQFDGELRVVGRSAGAGLPGADVKEGKLKGAARIGAYSFPNPSLSVRDLPPDFPQGPLVGSRMLRNFVVSLDQRRGRLRLAREGSTTIELGGVREGAPPAATSAASAAGSPNTPALADYAGTYGDRTLALVDGKLTIQRPGGRQLELTETGKDAFTIIGIPAAKIEFMRGASGKVEEIRVLNQQGQWERAKRDAR
ncbi:MAG TPA: aspartyl protease family protein [Gemmatimonadaceae bacterium]|nr:aspartyl protease family protein [Gemmatimonadaceae bacterium]